MAMDNGLYLLMIRVVKSWFTRPGPTCMTNCSCPIYCNPSPMSYSEPTCIVIDWLLPLVGLMWPKKVWSFFVDELVWLYSCRSSCLCVSWVLAKTAPSAIGPRIPLLYVLGQSLGYLIKQYSGKHGEGFLGFTHSLVTQWANYFFPEVSVHMSLPLARTDIKRSPTSLLHCMHEVDVCLYKMF